MNDEKLKKKQSLKVIISEAIMVLVVIITVAILALIVSGYWLNSDFKVERQGMLQVASVPTGANFEVDGESSWFQRTNTSKVLNSGEHTVVLSKEGYDTWTKTINISEGLLYRLHYPRLFLEDRKTEKVLDTAKYSFATISPRNDKLLLANDTTQWAIVDLTSEKPTLKKLDFSKYLPGASLAEGATVGIFSGEIIQADWDLSGNHVLFKIKTGDTLEWILFDINNEKNSLNLSKEFGSKFDSVEILDNTSNNLLTTESGRLRKIDVPSKVISAVIAENVVDFDHFENEVVFISLRDESKYEANLVKIGSDEITNLKTYTKPTRAVISKFYDEMYITSLQEKTVSLYKKVDFEHISDFELSFAPEHMKVGHNGEFITMHTGSQIATLDMESNSVREWQVPDGTFGWINDDMIYAVEDGELTVYDFDGYNRRTLAKNVSNRFPAAMTDDKWLYYFSDGNLTREWLIPR